ncbi:PA1414 family protein [Pseudomonas sp.]|nr:PA1414 family protein [Pseudomonas sp.]
MKAWLSNVCWHLGVMLGLIEPPRLEPIRVRAQRDRPTHRR